MKIYPKSHPLQAPADFFSGKDGPHFGTAFIPLPVPQVCKSLRAQGDVQAGCSNHPRSRRWKCRRGTRPAAGRRFAPSLGHNTRIATRLYPGARLRCPGLSEMLLQLVADGPARLAALPWSLVVRPPRTPRHTEPPCPGK